jgi:peptidyl-prolyl cis-trans isomerase A (cyclophilin A)
MENGIYAKFNTAKGSILVKLTHDLTPGTVGNFVALAEGNLKIKPNRKARRIMTGSNFTASSPIL